MWNQFLNESKSERRLNNTPVLVLGNRHSGKRSLIDSLFDISKTTMYNKKGADTNKLKLKQLTPIIDYAYLNVLDLTDPDYRTHSKLQIHMVQDKFNPEVFSQLHQSELLKKAVVVLMLDFTNPWSFMEQLDSWIKFLYDLQKSAGFSITELEDMAETITKVYKQYKQPEFDENGKVKRTFKIKDQEAEQIDIPLPDGVLSNNLRMPFIICVNKCDLQSSVIRDQSVTKIQYILYHLRKFCIQYGGSLIYTSIKNNVNLNVLYEYILHRAYDMPLRFKPQSVNQEAIFIPFGYDNMNLLEDSVLKMDMSKPYQEMITAPANKKVDKQQVKLEDDAEFFKRHINTSGTASITTAVNSSARDQSSSSSNPQTTQVTRFFQKLLNSNNNAGNRQRVNASSNNASVTDAQRRTQAQNTLLMHTKKQVQLNKQGQRQK